MGNYIIDETMLIGLEMNVLASNEIIIFYRYYGQ